VPADLAGGVSALMRDPSSGETSASRPIVGASSLGLARLLLAWAFRRPSAIGDALLVVCLLLMFLAKTKKTVPLAQYFLKLR